MTSEDSINTVKLFSLNVSSASASTDSWRYINIIIIIIISLKTRLNNNMIGRGETFLRRAAKNLGF